MTNEFHLETKGGDSSPASGGLPQEETGNVVRRHWMQRSSSFMVSQGSLSANQRTSISAMISYISTKSGQSEIRLERILSDHFNVPNPKCLPANDYDKAIRYLADIISM
ncbi:MAG: hypothetical protein WC521_03285 [Bdellovibrionales bacterium]